MWTIADFKGCIEFRPLRLKIQILPYDNCDIEEIAINLDKSGLIRNYSVQGVRYLKIVNFERHQNPHKNERAAGSDIPDIPKDYKENNDLQNITINREQNGTTRADSLLLIPDSLLPDSRIPIPDKPEKTRGKELSMLTDLGVDEQHAKDWLTVRKAKRAPLTQTVIEKLTNEARKAGISVADAVHIAAENSWQGFKASWLLNMQHTGTLPAMSKTAQTIQRLQELKDSIR